MRFCIKFIVILVILATCLEVNQAKRGGGSRGSSSRSSSSSSRSSSSSSRSSSSSSRSSSSSSRRGSSIGTKIRNAATKIKNAVKPKKTPSVSSSSSSSSGSKNPFSSSSSSSQPKKKSKLKKRLKQAALIGAGAYVGYKLGKLKEKFSNRKWGGGSSSNVRISIGGSSSIRRPRYKFNDWNSWREADGFLCRSNDDCKWVDNNLNCEDYEFDFSPAAGWFGGDTVSIRGECNCEQGYRWNKNQLSCDPLQRINGNLAVGAIIGIVIACLIGFCCCCGICCLIGKTLLSN